VHQNETLNANSYFVFFTFFIWLIYETVFKNSPFCILIFYVTWPILVFVNALKNWKRPPKLRWLKRKLSVAFHSSMVDWHLHGSTNTKIKCIAFPCHISTLEIHLGIGLSSSIVQKGVVVSLISSLFSS